MTVLRIVDSIVDMVTSAATTPKKVPADEYTGNDTVIAMTPFDANGPE
jgi:hypothetical protein